MPTLQNIIYFHKDISLIR